MTDPIRINLGCGRRKKPGYINVDLKQRGEHQPDVIADIRDLPFDDNYADEVLSVHVVEHFYLWEVEDIIKEWVRVLKPGGMLVIECPDLVKACYHMINAITMDKEPHPQMTYWPIFGDPGHKDPYMCHRWGWTPQTLGELLSKLNLRDIKEMEPLYHMRSVRDMRMEAIKCE